jgi:hypothetical protein
MTTSKLAADSGMEEFQIESLAHETTWENIPIGLAKRYLIACRVDLADPRQMKRIDIYLRGKMLPDGTRKRPCFRYLKKDPLWQSYYLPMMNRYRESLVKKGTVKA